MDPELLKQLLAQMMQAAPSYDKNGNQEAYDLDYQKSAANYQQDQFDLLGDPLLSMFAGGGGYDPSAFQDVEDGFDTFDIPSNPSDAYRGLDPNSEEGYIAKAISGGASPSAIVEYFKTEKGYANSQDDKALDRVRDLSQSLFEGNYEFQQQSSMLPEGGRQVGNQWQVPKMVRSDAAKQFDKMGLPTPDQRFVDADFGWGADRQSSMDADGAALSALESFAADRKRVYGQAQRDFDGTQAFAQNVGMDVGPDGPPRLAGTRLRSGRTLGDGAIDYEALRNQPRQPQISKTDPSRGGAVTAEMNTYREQRRAATDEFLRQQQTNKTNTLDKSYAKRMTELHDQAGMTPLTMLALQKVKALRGLGG